MEWELITEIKETQKYEDNRISCTHEFEACS